MTSASTKINLGYVTLRRSPLRRFPQLFIGLFLYGFTLAVMVKASLGANPWSVLYEGLALHLPLSFGTISAIIGVLVLLAWIPIKQKPGLGTVANIFVLAVAADFGLYVLPDLDLAGRALLLVAGVGGNGLAIAIYVGARFGPGPRDGLMTGLSALTGKSIRLVRTGIEVTVLILGFALGGAVGVGTVLYALGVGPVTQFFLPYFAYRTAPDAGEKTMAVKDA